MLQAGDAVVLARSNAGLPAAAQIQSGQRFDLGEVFERLVREPGDPQCDVFEALVRAVVFDPRVGDPGTADVQPA